MMKEVTTTNNNRDDPEGYVWLEYRTRKQRLNYDLPTSVLGAKVGKDDGFKVCEPCRLAKVK